MTITGSGKFKTRTHTYISNNLETLILQSQGSSFTKIRPKEKIDNFAFKNSNIIIEGLI